MPIVHAAIMPHGDALLPTVQPQPAEIARVRSVMAHIGASLASAQVDAILLLSPHNLRIRGQLAVTASAFVEGSIEGPVGRFEIRLPVARELAQRVAQAARQAGVPAAEVSYATADGDLSCLPLDWGSLVPLYFLTQGGARPLPVCVVGPPRDLGLLPLSAVGRQVARATGELRVSLIASADLGHAHLADGPYGYHPAAARYDVLVQEAVQAGDLALLQDLPADLVDAAKADAPWQLAILEGALGGPRRALRWAYGRPTYFGMLAAELDLRDPDAQA